MGTLKLLTDFYRVATFEDFSKMMSLVMPHTGEEYHREKFARFQRDLSGWLCDLTAGNLRKIEKYLQLTSIADWLGDRDGYKAVGPHHLQYRLEGYHPDTLLIYLAVMTDEDQYEALLRNLDGIEKLLFTKITETGGVDFDSPAPASETDESTKTQTHQS